MDNTQQQPDAAQRAANAIRDSININPHGPFNEKASQDWADIIRRECAAEMDANQRLTKLEKALAFYAKADNWMQLIEDEPWGDTSIGVPKGSKIDLDMDEYGSGALARATLAEAEIRDGSGRARLITALHDSATEPAYTDDPIPF